jgi:hypothetical protein
MKCKECPSAYIDPATVGVLALRPAHNCGIRIKLVQPYYEKGIAPAWCPKKEDKNVTGK